MQTPLSGVSRWALEHVRVGRAWQWTVTTQSTPPRWNLHTRSDLRSPVQLFTINSPVLCFQFSMLIKHQHTLAADMALPVSRRVLFRPLAQGHPFIPVTKKILLKLPSLPTLRRTSSPLPSLSSLYNSLSLSIIPVCVPARRQPACLLTF